MGPIHTLDDLLDMVRRRLGLILAVIVLGAVASVFYALSRTHVYQSAEVIQIVQPKIADELAPSTVEGSAARRLQLIEQQLMARNNLLDIMDRFGLYENMPGMRTSEKVHLMRQSIMISGVAAPREGFGDDGVISVLTITATMDDPQLAQQVAHEFADLTRSLAENQRLEQTRETLAFFQQQERDLMAELAKLEDEIVLFRSANNLSLDGTIEFRREELASLNDALLELDRELIAAELSRSRIDRSARQSTVAREEAELQAELDSLTTQRQLLQARRVSLEESLETSPEVERALTEFQRRRAQVQARLDLVTTRRTEAEVGYSLENADRGERLITLEEAQVPDYPISTRRRNVVFAGVLASILAGLGLAFLLDLRRPVIRTAAQMERDTGLRPVVSIPQIGTPKKRGGGTGFWQNRRAAGRRGRDARMARVTQARQS